MNTESKIVSLDQAEKVHGLYELVNKDGDYGYRLLARLKDKQAMQKAREKVIAERLIAMMIVP